MRQRIKVVVERAEDSYVAHPVRLRWVVVSDGVTFEEALANVGTVIAFQIENFGSDIVEETIVAERRCPLLKRKLLWTSRSCSEAPRQRVPAALEWLVLRLPREVSTWASDGRTLTGV